MKITPCATHNILNPCTLEGLNYQVDPYIGCEHYCYYCYALDQAKTDWSKEIHIHKDMTRRLEAELAEIEPQVIYLGWQTDPYQPCEAESRQTRQALEVFVEKGFSASILTKSDLVLRDIDLLQKMNNPRISTSVAFNTNQTRRLFEANTVETERRIAALHELKNAGIRTDALICPVLPYITNAIPLIDALVPCTELIWIYGLAINDSAGQNWLNIKQILNREFPDLLEQIEPIVFSKEHTYWKQLEEELLTLKNERHLNLNIHL